MNARSGFQARAHIEQSTLVAGRKLPTSRDVAGAGYEPMMAGAPVAIPAPQNKATAFAPRVMPRRAMPGIVRRAQELRAS